MIRLPIPEYDAEEYYLECVSETRNNDLKNELTAHSNIIKISSTDYRECAERKELFSYVSNPNLPDCIKVAGSTKVSDDEFYKVYSRGCSSGPGKYLYDRIMVSAPNGVCAFCGIGFAESIDHYLPRSKFRELAVVPINLVPACKACNEAPAKGQYVPSKYEDVILHPYFDDYSNEQWLYADVEERDDGFAINYFVSLPVGWPQREMERLEFNLDKMKWAELFSKWANAHLNTVTDIMIAAGKIALRLNRNFEMDTAFVSTHLTDIAQEMSQRNRNKWDTALYQALAQNERFCQKMVRICAVID